MICCRCGFFFWFPVGCRRIPGACAVFGTQRLRLAIGYKPSQYHSQRIFWMSMTGQLDRRFYLEPSHDLAQGQRFGRFPQELAAKSSKSGTGAGTGARMKRQQALQLSLDHFRAAKIGKANNSLLDYSNALHNGGSLELENLQPALQLTDNRLQLLMLGRLDGKRLTAGSLAFCRMVHQNHLCVLRVVRAFAHRLFLTFQLPHLGLG